MYHYFSLFLNKHLFTCNLLLERDQLVRYKFKWTDADISPIDNKLDKKEFFSFRHPEHSPQLIENMILTIINSLGMTHEINYINRVDNIFIYGPGILIRTAT